MQYGDCLALSLSRFRDGKLEDCAIVLFVAVIDALDAESLRADLNDLDIDGLPRGPPAVSLGYEIAEKFTIVRVRLVRNRRPASEPGGCAGC